MGITGLLPFLKGIQRDVHVSAFRGKKVAVDAYCWLHKGAYSCAMQLVMKTESVDKLPFIKYCVKRVNLLRQHNITPVMVFDGGYLPSKSKTEKERREKRKVYMEKGKALLKDGKRSEAVDCFQKCVDVSPEMALAFIKECRSMGVECIVAPYEADAQLAYLQKEGIVELVITEDSDLLVFGCKQVLFKLDDSGNGKLIQLQELGRANSTLIGFTEDSFRQMCILSGCDYLPSIPGIGLSKASKLMRKYNLNPYRLIRSMQSETSKVPKDYEAEFRRAEHTFLYQLVFDPRTQAQVHLNRVPSDVDPSDLQFCGDVASPKKAVGIARGNINPFTHEVMDDYSPSKAPPPKSTSWDASAMGSANRQYPVAVQARLPLASSQGSRRQFQPPKKSRPTPVEDASLGDEDLQSIYSDQQEEKEKPQCKTVTISRFFANPATEDTPLDGAIPRATRAVRKLELEPLSEDTSQRGDASEKTERFQTMTLSSLPNDVIGVSIPESPVEAPPQRKDFVRTLSRKRLFEQYSYSKKRRTEPMCEGNPQVTPRNPFSKTSPTKTTASSKDSNGLLSDRTSSSIAIERSLVCSEVEPSSLQLPVAQETWLPSVDGAYTVGGSAMPVSDSHTLDTGVQSMDEANSEQTISLVDTSSEQQSSHSFMTSEDFITTPNAATDVDSMSVETGSISEACYGSDSSSVSITMADSQPSSMEVVDLTYEPTAELCLSTEATSTPRPCSMLLSALTARRASSDSTRRRKGPKVGLSRRSSSTARFKPPGPIDQSALKQTGLHRFTFQKRPQMT